MLKVEIGKLEFEITTRKDVTSVTVTQKVRGESVTVYGADMTAEAKAAFKAILAYI
jgi:predicted metal-dependent enzyme (double-stranded beta helix superfamily)